MPRKLLIALAFLLPGLAAADYCDERAGAALAELNAVLVDSPDGSQAQVARDVLVRVCRDAQADGASAAASEAAEAESSELLGVEIKKAPEGAAGYLRTRKSP
jgi:hypothetical protein